MSEVQAAISRNVGVLRAVRGLRTDTAIAEILGCGISTVSKKMNGSRKWTIEEVETLANYFQIPPSRLLGEPSDLLDPNLRATGTSGSTSTNVLPDGSTSVIPFPLVEARSWTLPTLATVIPLQRDRTHHNRPSRAVAI